MRMQTVPGNYPIYYYLDTASYTLTTISEIKSRTGIARLGTSTVGRLGFFPSLFPTGLECKCIRLTIANLDQRGAGKTRKSCLVDQNLR